MTVTLDLDPATEQRLLLQAQALGLSIDAYLQDVLHKQAVIAQDIGTPLGISGSLLPAGIYADQLPRQLKSGRGLFAKYGLAPSAEEIDENRQDMFRAFAQSF